MAVTALEPPETIEVEALTVACDGGGRSPRASESLSNSD